MVPEESKSPNIERLCAIYQGIMNVVVDRLDAVTEAISEVEQNPDHPNSWRNAEFCYLQIRKTVEYVALALLAAHKSNEYECERLENAYKADVIFNDLAKVNRHGFPMAFEMSIGDQEDVQHHIAQRPTLSKRRMKRIYDDCAVHLHAGTLSNIINDAVPPYDLPRVAGWRDELLEMLGQHQVMLPHVGLVMLVWLKAPDSGTAKVVICQAEGAFQIEGDTNIYNDVDCQ